ncbi:MAG TPA: RNA 2',3'-cyclic phosphodiesterase [Spongiibacteraceae bacterium]|jgi:2'-5' RNA ligase
MAATAARAFARTVALMRLFFGVPIPPTASAMLAALCARLQTQRGWHWVAERNWHITLAFLGETDGNDVSALSELGENVAAEHSVCNITLAQLQWWPSLNKPRLLAAVSETPGPLAPIRKALANGLREIGINFDSKPLRPHVTLMRLERGTALQYFELPSGSVDVDIESIALYRSERMHGETHYRPLWQKDLKSNPPRSLLVRGEVFSPSPDKGRAGEGFCKTKNGADDNRK